MELVAISIDEVFVGDELVYDAGNNPEDFSFSTFKVVQVVGEENFVISNINGGLEIHPNKLDQYIRLEKDI